MKTLKKIKTNYQITIDGPAGSGKSTIAKLLAQKLSYIYIDSGAMYRATTLYFIKNNLLNKSEKAINAHLKKIKIRFKKNRNNYSVILNNKDVSKEIRTALVNQNVSEVSSKKTIRTELVKRQREIAANCPVVMDGRDIGTTVFPDANLKIYLTASVYIRVNRRRKDLLELSETVSIKELIKQIQQRDNLDSSRKISPLSKAQDAIVIDTSGLTINNVLEEINLFLPNRL